MKYPYLNFNVVLIEPEIPNNTGNIGRLCVGSYSRLHLVGKMGFEITDSRVKRAGLDYWDDLELVFHESFDQWFDQVEDPSRIFFFSSHGEKAYFKQDFRSGDYLVFGKESVGLEKALLERFSEQVVKVPFPGKVRSFNLANAVAMAIGEGLRQLGE